MLNYYRHVLTLCKRLGVAVLLYFLCRVLFFLFYRSYFPLNGPGEFFYISWIGLRFDICAILIINAPFIFFSVFPAPFIGNKMYQAVLKVFFWITNTLGLAANCADLIYFRFVLKRLTLDAYTSMKRKSDFNDHLSFLITHNWYAYVICGLLIGLLIYLYKKTGRHDGNPPLSFSSIRLLSGNVLLWILVLGLTVIGMRGGLQLIPVSITDAGEYTSPRNIPLVINSPFSIFKTLGQEKLEETKYFSDSDCKAHYRSVQKNPAGRFRKMNVVIIILESFSKEYTGVGGRKSYTPFLDSLMDQSLVFIHAYANGKRSAEGIPAILAGIPTLMNEAYNSSMYADNEINSLASLLKSKGYTSAFFHGGTNGTMNFQSFAGLAGFDSYYGRSEYNNENDYDGHWGIWDEPFLQYFAHKQHNLRQPFLTAVFTLSSHDPYLIPEKYKDKFPGGSLDIHKSVQYSDYALRRYFSTIRREPWFANTLFVLTPDHTGVSADPYYANNAGQYSIPVIYYCPALHLKGQNPRLTQQADIMPAVLSLLSYDKPYFSFGTNPFDTTQEHFAVNFCNNMFQFFHNDNLIQFDGKKIRGFYNTASDSLLKNNRASEMTPEENKSFGLLRAFLQTYEECLIHNRMTLKHKQAGI